MRYLLHDVFSHTVKRQPENIAVIQEDFTTYSYKQLNMLANQYAYCIKKFKDSTKKHPFVGILSTVHSNSIAAVLGTLKIGCAYVPLDEHSPPERLKRIIRNINLDILCIDPVFYTTHHSLFEEECIKKIIFLTADCEKTHKKVIAHEFLLQSPVEDQNYPSQISDDLAYILHSSGSTGISKGIMLTHRNARTFVDWMHKEFSVTNNDIVMSRAPFKFDLSVFDIFSTFKAGAKLVCFDWNKVRSSEQRHKDYVNLIEREKATILYTTPSTFITLMNRGNLGERPLSLSRLMYAGEPFPLPQLRRLKKILPEAKMANIYGPTETNIITYYWIDEIPEDMTSVPLGKVVDDTEIIVVSEDKTRICEINEVGELWCRGGTVTLGYLGMKEKTNDCLVQSPFHPYPAFFWRTGDFGYLDQDGLLHYRGRQDHMVKVKGFRVEIGEVENVFAHVENLDEFCVVAIPHAELGNKLVAYYSEKKDMKIAAEVIKTYLEASLPYYMIPEKIIKLDFLPKTSSGKVDRVLLAENFSEAL